MKKPLHTVSDHAVVRYLERVKGMNIADIRALIGKKADDSISQGASGVISEGHFYKVQDGVVTTVAPLNKPKIGQTRYKKQQRRG
ncbi:MAG: hypothetical protein AAF755_10260 [Pseudomonadota bacterium]